MNQIRLIAIDVDGTLTDGKLHILDNGCEMKSFSIKDGLGIQLALAKGIKIMIITGRKSQHVTKRFVELGVDKSFIWQGISSKGELLTSLSVKHDIPLQNIAAIGDDINDLPMLTITGFSACPIDAVRQVKDVCHYCSSYKGGEGAVRDIIEYILNQFIE